MWSLMATSRLDLDRVATILVEAVFFGDTRTSQRNGITTRTIMNYRQRLNEDSELSTIFAIKKREFEKDWATEIPAAIRSGIRFLLDATKYLEPTSENIYAVTGMVKVLTEIGLTKEIIDARLAGYYREDRTEDRTLDSGSSYSGNSRETES